MPRSGRRDWSLLTTPYARSETDSELPRAVLVTGAHRSGTTLVGELLGQAAGTWTVWEPFNQFWGLGTATGPYPWIRSDEPDPLLDSLADYLAEGWATWRVKRGPGAAPAPWLRERLRQVQRYWLWRANRGGTAVIKDPFALLALNGLQARVTRGPALVTIRHPCSWILSLRRVGWPAEPELESLRRRSELARRYFPDLLSGRGNRGEDDIETGALAWTCLYQAVLGQVRDGARVVVIPMERLGRPGEETLSAIFRAAGLEAPTNLAELARRYTGSDNSVTPSDGAVHLLRRNSAALSQAWRTQMSLRDQDRVREITRPVFDVVYSDWDMAEGDINELRG